MVIIVNMMEDIFYHLSVIFIILAKIGRFDESAISGVRSLQPEGIPPETVARCIGLPVEEVKALQENF